MKERKTEEEERKMNKIEIFMLGFFHLKGYWNLESNITLE